MARQRAKQTKPITPHLWFDKEAKEAAEFYTSIFQNSRIKGVTTLRDTPSGDTDIVSFTLAGRPFMAISAEPLFRFNPSVSFLVSCETKAQVQDLWDRLAAGGKTLMELGGYPFSERYGRLQNRYGLSWQLIFTGDREVKQHTPSLLFVGAVCGKAEEAINFYVSVFKQAPPKGGESAVGDINRYAKGMEPDKEGTIAFATFTLDGQEFGAMDSAREHEFAFNEAISFMVSCDRPKRDRLLLGTPFGGPRSRTVRRTCLSASRTGKRVQRVTAGSQRPKRNTDHAIAAAVSTLNPRTTARIAGGAD